MEKQVDKVHYNFERYCYPERWGSYYYQIREIIAQSPRTVMEVGAGDYTVREYVRQALACTYTTVDIAEDLKPDIKAPINRIPVADDSYDVMCAFEVLEHIPFDKVESALIEMKRISKKTVLISVPHFGPAIKFNIKIPCIPEIRCAFKVPIPLIHRFNGQHYWELGKRGYSPRMFRVLLRKHFTLVKEFVPYENQYHHFFVLNI